jgi:hypothetical protein
MGPTANLICRFDVHVGNESEYFYSQYFLYRECLILRVGRQLGCIGVI